ncbi:MAG: response regulator [Rhodocyclaceae bacterium]|nr:response regulator [Rhodocyclaceae bacterium]
MIVDDHSVNREVAKAYVEVLGWSALGVTSGEEALAALEREPFDAMLLDINMPGLSGIEVLRALRADPRTREQWVIAYTAHALSDELGRLLELGFDGVLVKPIELDQIQTELARVPERS